MKIGAPLDTLQSTSSINSMSSSRATPPVDLSYDKTASAMANASEAEDRRRQLRSVLVDTTGQYSPVEKSQAFSSLPMIRANDASVPVNAMGSVTAGDGGAPPSTVRPPGSLLAIVV